VAGEVAENKSQVVMGLGLTAKLKDIIAENFDLKAMPDQLDPKARVLVAQATNNVDRKVLDSLPNLELVVVNTAGFDRIDIATMKERGIMLANARGAHDICVSDMAMALLFAAVRRVPAAERFVREGKWLTSRFPVNRRVTGRRMGIYGMGSIGAAIAKRGFGGFDMEVGYYNRNPRSDVPYRYFDSLLGLAEWCDFFMIACPLTDATRGTVTAEVLKAIGPEGCLVNIARGAIVDEPAMVEALMNGTLGCAGLDTVAKEPNVPEKLMTLDNVVVTPHYAWATSDSQVDVLNCAVANVESFLRTGKPVGQVNLADYV